MDASIHKQRGLIKHVQTPVKVLGNGQLEAAVEVVAHSFSRSAKEKIEKAGGQAIVC